MTTEESVGSSSYDEDTFLRFFDGRLVKQVVFVTACFLFCQK